MKSGPSLKLGHVEKVPNSIMLDSTQVQLVGTKPISSQTKVCISGTLLYLLLTNILVQNSNLGHISILSSYYNNLANKANIATNSGERLRANGPLVLMIYAVEGGQIFRNGVCKLWILK